MKHLVPSVVAGILLAAAPMATAIPASIVAGTLSPSGESETFGRNWISVIHEADASALMSLPGEGKEGVTSSLSTVMNIGISSFKAVPEPALFVLLAGYGLLTIAWWRIV